MRLTKNFTTEEFTKTSTNLINEPDWTVQKNLLWLCVYLMQPIRDKWGSITVTSGYRTIEVNTAVGGSLNSQHISGEACDFTHLNLGGVYKYITESSLEYGQLILENQGGKKWIHISLPRLSMPNRQNWMFDGETYIAYT